MTDLTEPFLSLRGIGKRYGGMIALDGIDLAVPAGARLAIVGRSGSGKTTLLRIIAGFETADCGRVMLEGRVLADGGATVPAHRRGIGYVPQDGALFPHLSVGDNIGFGLDRAMPGRDARVAEMMDMVELDRRMLGRRPHELSGGQQQRVALARALARQPRLMLLDEPFSALDTGLRDSMRKAVARVLRTAGVTTILVTHDQGEALSFADHVAVLRQGRLAQAGSPQELYHRPCDRDTAVFLGDAIVLPAELGDGWANCGLGRVAADTGARRGPAEIMLRPEQLRLMPGRFDGATALHDAKVGDSKACHGRVTDVEFGGAVCKVTVAVTAGGTTGTTGAAAMPPLPVRCSSLDLPSVGAEVRIAVLGTAHVFGNPAGAAGSRPVETALGAGAGAPLR